MSEFRIKIRRPDDNLIDRVRQIADEPETKDTRIQIAVLATAVADLADYCDGLFETLDKLTKNVTFKPKK